MKLYNIFTKPTKFDLHIQILHGIFYWCHDAQQNFRFFEKMSVFSACLMMVHTIEIVVGFDTTNEINFLVDPLHLWAGCLQFKTKLITKLWFFFVWGSWRNATTLVSFDNLFANCAKYAGLGFSYYIVVIYIGMKVLCFREKWENTKHTKDYSSTIPYWIFNQTYSHGIRHSYHHAKILS